MESITNGTVVLDIGKTNAKLTLLNVDGQILAEQRCPNTIINTGLYPHHDTDRLWVWLLAILKDFSTIAEISAIVPITHGATVALVDDTDLVLPVLDYESTIPETINGEYSALRPRFTETLSPDLPAGLNLGRQLYWLKKSYPQQFDRARQILTYPQYWSWRLSGVAASEVTSLGCHTDLWQPLAKKYSSLVDQMGWEKLLPPMRTAWSALGPLRADLLSATGLPAHCQILCGIHDSNASLLRHLGTESTTSSLSVLSTGTWVIAAAMNAPFHRLREGADMLANVSALGEPISCMRFMGGREFSMLAGPEPKPCSMSDLQRLLEQSTFALPCFAESGGPFCGQVGIILGPPPQTSEERYALATLYCVLMTDYCLSALESEGPIFVEGSFTANPYFSKLLQALRSDQTVSFSSDASGTTCGGWMLHHWGREIEHVSALAGAIALPKWRSYRDRWLVHCDQTRETATEAVRTL